jgi:hypothetical protein
MTALAEKYRQRIAQGGKLGDFVQWVREHDPPAKMFVTDEAMFFVFTDDSMSIPLPVHLNVEELTNNPAWDQHTNKEGKRVFSQKLDYLVQYDPRFVDMLTKALKRQGRLQ